MNKRYNYLYKIINKLDNKFYIGVHSTMNIDDGYFGSGTHLRNAINLYGKDNFFKEIIFYYDSSEEAYAAERFIVTKSWLKFNKDNCYNIQTGGRGGWTEEERIIAKQKVHQNKGKTLEEIVGIDKANKIKLNRSNRSKGLNNNMFGKKHSIQSKQQMSDNSLTYSKAVLNNILDKEFNENSNRFLSKNIILMYMY